MVVQFLKFIFCTVFFWVVFPLLYILLSPFYLFRYLLSHLQKYVHPDWVGLVNIRDAFLYEYMQNPKGLTHAIPLVAYLSDSERVAGGPADPEERVLDLYRSILQKKNARGELLYEKMTFYPETWWGFPFWKREKAFKLENHVKMCEAFLNQEVTEEELETFVGDYNHKPFPAKYSPWEVFVFKMKKVKESEPQKYGLYFRFHHILLDGLSMARMGNIIDVDSAKDKLKTISPFRSTWKTKLLFAVKLLAFLGYDLVKLLVTDIDRNAWKIPPDQLTNKNHMISTPAIDYDLVRQASKKQGVSPTAIFFGCFAGAVHNFMREQGEAIPSVMRLAVAMPVPNHPLEGMVNHWTFAEVDLPVNDPNSTSRVRKIENNLLFLKKRATTGILWVITPLHAAIPYKLLNYLANNHMTTLMGSNFPGPKSMIQFAESYDMESFRGYLPRLRGNSAVGLASFTYNQCVRFSVCVDKGLMPKRQSARQLLDLITSELEKLAQGQQPRESHLKSY